MLVPHLKAPIVLVHGLLGFGRMQVANWVVANYFHGVAHALEAAGNRVLAPSLSPTCGIEARAGQLKAFLDLMSPNEPVHLIGHSMGGLDARYLISCLGMAERVLSLTTLGTPHRGTIFADWSLRRVERLLKPVFEFGSVPYQAFYDLTAAHAEEFNARTPDAPNVRYYSVAGRIDSFLRHPHWVLPGSVLDWFEGPNDGIVSVASAKYGTSFEEWDADHFGLINWPNLLMGGAKVDRLDAFGGLIRRLADEGF